MLDSQEKTISDIHNHSAPDSLFVQSNWSNIKTTPGHYFNKWLILNCKLRVVCLWNTSPEICGLRAASLVISELWAVIQPVCELQAVSPEVYWEFSELKMEIFSKLINGFQQLTNSTKNSILDIRLGYEYPSGVNNQPVSWEWCQSALYQVYNISLHYFKSLLKTN